MYATKKEYEENDKIQLFERDIKCKNGKVKNVESSTIFMNFKDKKKSVTIFRDISNEKKLEKLSLKIQEKKILLEKTLEYDKIKTDFYSNISHELRTPLNLLFSSVQLLNMYTSNIQIEESLNIKKYLGIMKQNCFRLLRLINNFLDITKIDAGFYQLNNNITRTKIGSGIGLSLVKSLVKIHDGTIEVKSNFGEGTEFLISLPVKEGEFVYQIDLESANKYESKLDSNIEKLNIEFSDIYSI